MGAGSAAEPGGAKITKDPGEVHLAGDTVHATVDLQVGPEVVARRMNFIAATAAGVGRSTSFKKHFSALLGGKNIEAECWLSCITAS
mmetsp:Transcript_57361/g.100491  ORF Transcript_57361/g.100491 Transcript_57361/m.100491 type:complete len:87 (+) Transcript_57361:223-483(+)